jgi:hypothetical protein
MDRAYYARFSSSEGLLQDAGSERSLKLLFALFVLAILPSSKRVVSSETNCNPIELRIVHSPISYEEQRGNVHIGNYFSSSNKCGKFIHQFSVLLLPHRLAGPARHGLVLNCAHDVQAIVSVRVSRRGDWTPAREVRDRISLQVDQNCESHGTEHGHTGAKSHAVVTMPLGKGRKLDAFHEQTKTEKPTDYLKHP